MVYPEGHLRAEDQRLVALRERSERPSIARVTEITVVEITLPLLPAKAPRSGEFFVRCGHVNASSFRKSCGFVIYADKFPRYATKMPPLLVLAPMLWTEGARVDSIGSIFWHFAYCIFMNRYVTKKIIRLDLYYFVNTHVSICT